MNNYEAAHDFPPDAGFLAFRDYGGSSALDGLRAQCPTRFYHGASLAGLAHSLSCHWVDALAGTANALWQLSGARLVSGANRWRGRGSLQPAGKSDPHRQPETLYAGYRSPY